MVPQTTPSQNSSWPCRSAGHGHHQRDTGAVHVFHSHLMERSAIELPDFHKPVSISSHGLIVSGLLVCRFGLIGRVGGDSARLGLVGAHRATATPSTSSTLTVSQCTPLTTPGLILLGSDAPKPTTTAPFVLPESRFIPPTVDQSCCLLFPITMCGNKTRPLISAHL